MFLLPPSWNLFCKIVRLNFYSLLCTDGKIILIILSSGNTRYLSYIGMNHDWWLIDHEWWFVVSDCDCDCPESDFEFLVLLALKHSFTVRLLTLRDLYRDSIFDNIWQYLTLLTIVFLYFPYLYFPYLFLILYSPSHHESILCCLNNMLLLLYMWPKLFV